MITDHSILILPDSYLFRVSFPASPVMALKTRLPQPAVDVLNFYTIVASDGTASAHKESTKASELCPHMSIPILRTHRRFIFKRSKNSCISRTVVVGIDDNNLTAADSSVSEVSPYPFSKSNALLWYFLSFSCPFEAVNGPLKTYAAFLLPCSQFQPQTRGGPLKF